MANRYCICRIVSGCLSDASSPCSEPDSGRGIVGNGVRVTATHRGMADIPQASTPGENSSHPLQIVATTYGHDTNYMYRMLFHHLNPHHAHLTADGYHDGSQLAESDRSTLW